MKQLLVVLPLLILPVTNSYAACSSDQITVNFTFKYDSGVSDNTLTSLAPVKLQCFSTSFCPTTTIYDGTLNTAPIEVCVNSNSFGGTLFSFPAAGSVTGLSCSGGVCNMSGQEISTQNKTITNTCTIKDQSSSHGTGYGAYIQCS